MTYGCFYSRTRCRWSTSVPWPLCTKQVTARGCSTSIITWIACAIAARVRPVFKSALTTPIAVSQTQTASFSLLQHKIRLHSTEATGLTLEVVSMEPHSPTMAHEMPRQFEANPEYLQQLKDLDIPEEEAKKALILTGNVSAEEAAIFYFDSLENRNLEEEEDQNYYKMVFVVNMELSMGVGKIAAQVGHAAVGLYQLMQEEVSHRETVCRWDEQGAKKVVLQGSGTTHLMELQALALSLGLPTYIVQDAGRTQIAAGSHTVLSIMGEEELVNKVTGKLKLLN